MKPTDGPAFLLPELNTAQLRMVNEWLEGAVEDAYQLGRNDVMAEIEEVWQANRKGGADRPKGE